MRYLIVARHGEYEESSGSLTDRGRAQIGGLANKLKPLMASGGVACIVASPATRARESGDILGSVLGIEKNEIAPILQSWMLSEEDLVKTLELVKSRQEKVDTMILVGHLECVREFPCYFAKEELGMIVPSKEISKGTAWVIDCEQKTILHLEYDPHKE